MIAARHVPEYEIIDYAKSTKPDVPSGTARELAERLGAIAPSNPGVPIDKIIGPKETRGANIGGGRVHSVRLPSYVIAVEAIFGKAGERLTMRHDAGTSAEPVCRRHLARRPPRARRSRAWCAGWIRCCSAARRRDATKRRIVP